MHSRLNDNIRYYIQQDGAPPHCAKEVQDWLKDKFGDRFLDARSGHQVQILTYVTFHYGEHSNQKFTTQSHQHLKS